MKRSTPHDGLTPPIIVESERRRHKLESAVSNRKTIIAWVQQITTDKLLDEKDVSGATNATTLINAHEISTTVHEQRTTSQTTISQQWQ